MTRPVFLRVNRLHMKSCGESHSPHSCECSEIYLEISRIVSFYLNAGARGSTIETSESGGDENNCYGVTQTPRQIMTLIQEAKVVG